MSNRCKECEDTSCEHHFDNKSKESAGKLIFDGEVDELAEKLKLFANSDFPPNSFETFNFIQRNFKEKPQPVELKLELETILKWDGDDVDVAGSILELALVIQRMTKEPRSLDFIMHFLWDNLQADERIKED